MTTGTETDQDKYVRSVRSALMTQHAAHQRQADVWRPKAKPTAADAEKAESAAWLGNVMASNYGYALAATLKMIEDKHGTEAAFDIAWRVDSIINDGDEDGINADVSDARPPA